MAPAKKKASAGTTSNTAEQHEQHEEANTRIQDINNEAVLHGDLVDDTEIHCGMLCHCLYELLLGMEHSCNIVSFWL